MAKLKSPKRIRLVLREPAEDETTRSDLSAAVAYGPDLWTCNDELARVERLTRQHDGNFAAHRAFDIADYLDLPEGRGEEMDIEGLEIEDGYLWVLGSHSRTRKKPEADEHDPEKVLERLTTLKNSPNRYTLARLPLVPDPDQDGSYRPAQTISLTDEQAPRRAGVVRFRKKKGNDLRAILLDDAHLAPFMNVPAKENGFDMEGLVASGNRVLLGLRGPVLRGWAIVLDVVFEAEGARLHLCADDEDRSVRKHFLDLDGLGIRELRRLGDDVLILAGPTMDLDGPIELYLWPNAFADTESQAVVLRDELRHVMSVPYGHGVDHPEGLAVLGRDEKGIDLLVLYDSPAPERLYDNGRDIDADLFRLPNKAIEEKP